MGAEMTNDGLDDFIEKIRDELINDFALKSGLPLIKPEDVQIEDSTDVAKEDG